jgi:hypothetical protein
VVVGIQDIADVEGAAGQFDGENLDELMVVPENGLLRMDGGTSDKSVSTFAAVSDTMPWMTVRPVAVKASAASIAAIGQLAMPGACMTSSGDGIFFEELKRGNVTT